MHEDFKESHVHAFVSDLTADDLCKEITPSSVDIVTMVSKILNDRYSLCFTVFVEWFRYMITFTLVSFSCVISDNFSAITIEN
jgi:hypothetical protein